MIRHIPNIVTLKPIGGIITNNPNISSKESIERSQKIEAEKQAKLDELRDKFTQQHNKPK